MLGLKPIKLLPARERVASALRKAIISKQIAEGSVLTLESTAKELGVSTTPVREAFQILARDGLLELNQGKGAIVLGINETTLREHYQVRAALESYAAVMCCNENVDLSAIENCLIAARKTLEANDSDSFANYNQSFHYEIWTAAGNEKMKTMLSELWNGLSMGIKSTVTEYAKNSQEEHEAIFAAIKRRDSQAAGEEMTRHILRSLDDVLTRYQHPE